MLSYLKSDALVFSKDALLKQEEALVELDASIDDWVLKLELAENQRLRMRQKLLEHVAAAMTLNSPPTIKRATAGTTPPSSPTLSNSPARKSRAGSPTLGRYSPARGARQEVESIKVYAEVPVLVARQAHSTQTFFNPSFGYTQPPVANSKLFSDIEQAVARMCEAC